MTLSGLTYRVYRPLIFSVLLKTVQTSPQRQQYNSDGIVQETPHSNDFLILEWSSVYSCKCLYKRKLPKSVFQE